MTGYTKLFGSIVASTIWREDNETRILWITMLAMANKFGIVEAAIPGLADFARLTIPQTESGLAKLMSPDAYSRTKAHDGRRIEAVEGGWLILNHATYRARMSIDDRREYLRIKQAEQRQKKKRQHGVNTRQQMSTVSTQTETEAESQSNTDKERPASRSFSVPTLEEMKLFCAKSGISDKDAETMWFKWDGNGWTNGGKPIKKWTSTLLNWKNRGFLPSQQQHQKINGAPISETVGPTIQSTVLRQSLRSALKGLPQ